MFVPDSQDSFKWLVRVFVVTFDVYSVQIGCYPVYDVDSQSLILLYIRPLLLTVNTIDGSTARRCIAIVTNERRASYVIPLNSL